MVATTGKFQQHDGGVHYAEEFVRTIAVPSMRTKTKITALLDQRSIFKNIKEKYQCITVRLLLSVRPFMHLLHFSKNSIMTSSSLQKNDVF